MAYDVNFAIRKVSEDYERMKYNTAIAQMMSLVNAFYAKGQVTRGEMKALIQLLNPVAPHITEEINEICGFGGEVAKKAWPTCDERALVKESVEIALQVNGKLRGKLEVPTSLTVEGAGDYFMAVEDVLKAIDGRKVKKLIYVPGRLVNIVL
jgi:leucyl-tRNA synthetase